MNQKEAQEFFDGVTLNFQSYYKFTFTYSGEKDNKLVEVHFGGDSNDIYRTEFGPTEMFDKNFDFEYMSVSERDGLEVYSFYEY